MRGYSIVKRKNGTLVTSVQDVAQDDMLSVRFHDGERDVTVL